jgi:hypothetical protein
MRRVTHIKPTVALAAANLALGITAASAGDSIVRTSDAFPDPGIATYLPKVSVPPWIQTKWSNVVRLPETSPPPEELFAKHDLPFWAKPPMTNLTVAAQDGKALSAFASAD